MKIRFILTALFLVCSLVSWGQQAEKDSVAADTTRGFIIDPATTIPLTINLEAEEEAAEDSVKTKKKKRKKKVFYGIKTKKGFTKSGYGGQTIIEQFYYLKKYEEPDPYVRDVYWFDTKRNQIRTTHNITKDKALILHGPYKKMTEEGEMLEEGIFYKGTKHGRWTTYNKNNILMDKEKYTRGWPRESEVSYYDKDKRDKIKEVVPIEYGEEEGYYFYFHKTGRVAVEGEYRNGKKVGVWTEYYDFERRAKKQIKYPDDPFEYNTPPYTMKEWNPQGQVVYEYKKS